MNKNNNTYMQLPQTLRHFACEYMWFIIVSISTSQVKNPGNG